MPFSAVLGNFFGPIGIVELIVILLIALLIFGKRLPEVGRSVGKGITEFKKGLAGIEDDVTKAGNQASAPPMASTLPPPATQARQLSAPAIDPQVQEQLRSTQEQIRQLHEELRATKEQLAQAKKD